VSWDPPKGRGHGNEQQYIPVGKVVFAAFEDTWQVHADMIRRRCSAEAEWVFGQVKLSNYVHVHFMSNAWAILSKTGIALCL